MNPELKGVPPQRPEENLVAGSKEGVVIKNLQRKLEQTQVQLPSLSEEEIMTMLASTRMLPGVTAEGVLSLMKRTGLVAVSPSKKAMPPPAEKISLKTTLSGFTTVDDPEAAKMAAQRLREAELRRERKQSVEAVERDIFKDSKDLDLVYVQALSLGASGAREKPEYYDEFADAGLIKGGHAEVAVDLAEVAAREEQFKKKNAELDPEYAAFVEKNAKIATVVEQALAYGVSELGWYGKNVRVSAASRFDDVKRGVDEVLEITKENSGDKYIGLGIDVTYNGLLSERYRDKFERLLESIRVGQKTKIKYFKNRKGEPMREFAIPKVVLHFDGGDVKELAYFVKHSDDPAARERLAQSPMKVSVLNQVMIQCELLAQFAEASGNSISEQYREIAAAISGLGDKDQVVQGMLSSRHEDETSLRLRHILSKFEKLEVSGRLA